ncbi:MAG: hypothetical protein ABSD74_00155 [Rhizomicrobium sp.]
MTLGLRPVLFLISLLTLLSSFPAISISQEEGRPHQDHDTTSGAEPEDRRTQSGREHDQEVTKARQVGEETDLSKRNNAQVHDASTLEAEAEADARRSNSEASTAEGRESVSTNGMGGRKLTAQERAEFDAFADRAETAGLVENPSRTGSWGKVGPDGKFHEVARIDVGEAGKPGWRGETHVHIDGTEGDHLPADAKIPGEQK